MTKESNEEFVLPDKLVIPKANDPLDIVIISIPKMGKTVLLAELTKTANAITFDLERGGYDYVEARRISVYPDDEEERNKTDLMKAFENYINWRNVLLKNKGKYRYLIIDHLSELDALSELGGTYLFMNTIQGKKWNRDEKTGETLTPRDPDFRYISTMGDGHGYQYTRRWFLEQIEIFRQIAPYRIYAAHVRDKYIKDGNKEEVIGSELSLTGQLKNIFAAKVTTLCKMVAEDNQRYLNFDVMNDSIVAGSRAPKLKGKILISDMDTETNKLKVYWENIYQQLK